MPASAFSVGPAPPVRVRGSRAGASKPVLVVDESTFADLRQLHPPQDPAVLLQKFQAQSHNPASPQGTEVFQLVRTAGVDDRTARWQFWNAMSQIGFFVRELYCGTEYFNFHNCRAGAGAKGQHVIHTALHGTILWMSSTNRLYCPNPKGDIFHRMAVAFPAWSATADGWQAFDGRFPTTSTSHVSSDTVAHANAAPADFGLSDK